MAGSVVLAALRHTWVTLDRLGCPLALMGGLALSVWKHVRATRDVDLLIGLGPVDFNTILQELSQAGIRARHKPPILDLQSVRIIQLLYEPPGSFTDLPIDLLLAESDYHIQALERRVATFLPDIDLQIYVLSCEDLILHKLIAGRIIDRADGAALLRVNRASLDLDYLAKWINQLALGSEWAEIWREAFPGEAPPQAR